jgi:hypothetical protein
MVPISGRIFYFACGNDFVEMKGKRHTQPAITDYPPFFREIS